MLRRCFIGVAAPLLGIGCVPDPEINVPDFAPVPMMQDGGADGPVAQPDLSMPMPTMTWKAEVSHATATLRSVWVADASLTVAYAVGDSGTILRRSAGNWTREDSGTDKALYAVVGISADEAYAVGVAGTILHRKDGKWAAESAEPMQTATLFGLTRAGSEELYAVGETGTILRRKANKWQSEIAPVVAQLQAVWGTRPDDAYAVGDRVIFRRDGLAWRMDSATVPMGMGKFYAVIGTGASIFLAGGDGLVLRRGQTEWIKETTVRPMMGPAADLYGLYGSGEELWAVGQGGEVQHRTGAMKWEVEKSGTTQNLYGVAGAGPHILAVGSAGTIIKRF